MTTRASFARIHRPSPERAITRLDAVTRMAAAGRRNAAAASWLLTSLVLAAAIPLVLFGGWVAFLTADSGRTGARNAALETSVRVAERVSAEIAKEIEVGEALAASAALDGANLATFYAEAQRLAATRPLWETVWLSDTGGMQVLNVLRPLGSTLALDADPETLREAVRLREPLVGGIGPLGPISGKRLVALRVPVIRDGSLLYVLSIGLNPAAISTILANAGAPEGWIGAIVDANGNIIARTIAEEREAGQAASVSTRAAIAAAPQGFYTGRTLEGVEVETVYRALPGTAGWTVHFGIPRETLNAPVTRSVILLVVGGLLSLALAAALAALIARDLAQRRRIEEERASLALKLSEERGAVAVDAADLGTWRWDVSGSRVLGSQRTRTLLDLPLKMGTGDDAKWTTAEFLAAVHPSDRRDLEEALARCLSKGHILDVEFRVAGSGGGTRWVRATGRMTEGDPTTIHGVLVDIDPQKRAEAERRDLLRRLAQAQENEQRRIARELHDQVGQTVTGLALGLKGLESRLDGETVDPETRNHVRWLQGLAREVGRDIHRASSDLRPTALDDLGLQRALAAHAADWSRRYGITTDIQSLGSPERLPPEVETAIYRAVQEALTNVLKHAGARHVSIVLEHRNGELRVVVEDDGRGFEPDTATRAHGENGPPLGLSGMRERLSLVDGHVRIESAPGAGTTLFMHVPLAERSARHG